MTFPSVSPDLRISWSPAAVADANELSELFNAIAEVDDTPERLSATSMEHELTSYFDPLEERTLVARDPSDAIVGYATAYCRRSEAEEMRAYVNVYVAPSWSDRGLEDAMTDWAIEAGTRALDNVNTDRRFVCAWLFNKQEDASARFADRGFTPVRHWWDMEALLDSDIPPSSTEDFAIVTWEEHHDEPARLVYNTAFADHWGSTPMDESAWLKQVIESPSFNRDYSFVAVGDGNVVGYAACAAYPEDWESAGRREAWIEGLGVVRSWRKRGIASALLSNAMQAMKTNGMEAALIGVDSDSPSRAQHLYQRLGFTTKITGVTWQLSLHPSTHDRA